MKIKKLLLIILLLFPKVALAKKELVIGFVPSRSVNTIQISADKIAGYIAKKTNTPTKAITLSNYAAIVVGMKAKRIDIAFVGPVHYLILNKETGAYPITAALRDNKLGYRSLIIVNKNSNIKTLSDLKNKTFAFGDSLSASANLYPKMLLKHAGIDVKNDLRSINVDNQSAIALSVMQGKVDAGAIYEDARSNPEVLSKFPDILDKTIILEKSELIPADPQVVSKELDLAMVKKIQVALIALSDDTEGKKWLKEIYGIDSLVAIKDSDYDGLRKVVKEINPDLLK
jgi:phosphonate transport system substrate-binding protein